MLGPSRQVYFMNLALSSTNSFIIILEISVYKAFPTEYFLRTQPKVAISSNVFPYLFFFFTLSHKICKLSSLLHFQCQELGTQLLLIVNPIIVKLHRGLVYRAQKEFTCSRMSEGAPTGKFLSSKTQTFILCSLLHMLLYNHTLSSSKIAYVYMYICSLAILVRSQFLTD